MEVIKKKRLCVEIVEEIKLQIENGELKAGEKLPTIKKLAKNFQVGQASVREALMILQGMQLLVICQGKGVYIANTNKDETCS